MLPLLLFLFKWTVNVLAYSLVLFVCPVRRLFRCTGGKKTDTLHRFHPAQCGNFRVYNNGRIFLDLYHKVSLHIYKPTAVFYLILLYLIVYCDTGQWDDKGSSQHSMSMKSAPKENKCSCSSSTMMHKPSALKDTTRSRRIFHCKKGKKKQICMKDQMQL